MAQTLGWRAFSRSAIVEKQRFIPSVFSSRHFQQAACH
jgi:hypothetical protein